MPTEPFLSPFCTTSRCPQCPGIVVGHFLTHPCTCACHIDTDDGDPGQRTNPFTGRAWDDD